MSNDSVTIADVMILRRTDRAILCDVHGEEIWVPLSQVQDDSEVCDEGDRGFLVVSKWFALKENLF